MVNGPLTFQQAHKARDEAYEQKVNDWTLGDWGNAMAGEAGEACIDLGEAVRSKFNEVSARPAINSEIRL